MRIDIYLTQNGYAESRNKASKLIDGGLVGVDGRTVTKPSEEIDEDIPHSVTIKEHDGFVGRGGKKLEGAMDTFGLDVTGKRCIDVGASTGGFTQCLLMRGAASVVAVDSGRGQLHKSLLCDARVTNIEGYNARNLNAKEFGIFDCAVMDVSFISQTLIIPALSGIICENGFFVSLIKPQFEAGRQAIGKNGIVKRARDREYAILRVVECAQACGLSLAGITVSPIKGGDGNIEYLAYFIKTNSAEQISQEITDTINSLCREN
ncbi:MAG: TlyA family RNA methyltransferase [Clostridia bacterium]|nr:TlyA family RNA methyltransferase [Clostridia bacterium]